jgi:hypothetical protein
MLNQQLLCERHKKQRTKASQNCNQVSLTSWLHKIPHENLVEVRGLLPASGDVARLPMLDELLPPMKSANMPSTSITHGLDTPAVLQHQRASKRQTDQNLRSLAYDLAST